MLPSHVPAYAMSALIGLVVNGTLALLCLSACLVYRRYRPVRHLALFFLGLTCFFLGYTVYPYQEGAEFVRFWYRFTLLGLAWLPVAWLWFIYSLQGERPGLATRLLLVWAAAATAALLVSDHPALYGPLAYFEPGGVYRPQSWLLRPSIYLVSLAVNFASILLIWRRLWRLPQRPSYVRVLLVGLALWFASGLHDAAFALQLPFSAPGTLLWAGSILLSICLATVVAIQLRDLEAALERSRRNFAKAFQASPDWLSIASLEEGRLLEVNDAFVAGTGYSRAELLGRTVAELGLWADPDQRRRGVAALKAGRSLKDREIHWRSKDGREVTLIWAAEVVDWGGEPSLLSVAHDITGRKQVERELERHRHHLEEKVAARTVELTLANQELTREVRERQRTEAALRESRANLQTLFDTMQDFIFVLDGRGRVVQTNLQAARRLGYTLEEMDGLPVLELHPPEERDHALEVLADIMAGRTETCHIPLVTKQGQTIPVETKVAHGYWGDQAVIFGISRDITERRRAEESLTQLTGGVAHNFNNLLAAVLGNAQAARTELDKPGPNQANLRRLVDNVVRAADSGRGVVQRLAAYVGRRRRQEARPEALALSEAAEAALEIARAAYRHAGMAEVEVATRLDPELCVTAQRGELIEVFLNLIKNALEAMPGGGRLEMRSWREDGRACLSLADTGTGMDEETRRRVFQPFFSTKGVLGQGLGLASSRGIIRSLGGEITASSRPGRGTTITLSLPEAAPPAQAAEPAGPPGLAPGMEVLLVEDEGLVAAGLQSILEEAGFAVSLACRVDQACRALEDGLPDLVLCDLGLPDGSGWEVARRLAAVEKRAGRRAPLILVTGFAAEDGGERPEGAAPAYGVLYKPVDRTVLLDMIGEALAERREAAAS